MWLCVCVRCVHVHLTLMGHSKILFHLTRHNRCCVKMVLLRLSFGPLLFIAAAADVASHIYSYSIDIDHRLADDCAQFHLQTSSSVKRLFDKNILCPLRPTAHTHKWYNADDTEALWRYTKSRMINGHHFRLMSLRLCNNARLDACGKRNGRKKLVHGAAATDSGVDDGLCARYIYIFSWATEMKKPHNDNRNRANSRWRREKKNICGCRRKSDEATKRLTC